MVRIRLSLVVVFIFAIGIVAKMIDIQFFQGQKWKGIGKQIGLQFKTVKANRGNIYADNEALLATSLPFYKVAFDPTVATNEIYNNGIDSLCIMLNRFFHPPSTKYYKRKIQNAREKGRQYLLLSKDKIDYQSKKKMTQWPIFKYGKHEGGVIFEKVDQRFNPFVYLASRTIGFVNENGQGAGLEYSFNNQLAGKNGHSLYERIAGGSLRPVFDGTEVKPQDGWDIETTLDVNLQDMASSSLVRALIQHKASYGCVVVMEVASGEIKAMANLSRNEKNGTYGETYNYAIGNQGLTEPGSTFKLVSMIALFEETNRQLYDSIETGSGELYFYDQVMRDSKPNGYGKISIEEAFAKSSNIAVAKLVGEAFGLNPQRFTDYIKDLGLSSPLGSQLVGEGVPYIKTPEDPSWSGISLPWMSHGYGLKLTPLQILTLYNAVANNGKMIQPILVKRAFVADRDKERYQAAVINERICSKKTLQKVRQMLESVVEYGTARNIRDNHYRIAGKTGTAQKYIDGKYSRKNYYTSFVGYFPADKPKYSCIVVIDNPQGFNQYGSDVAAPVFKEIADKIYSLDIEMHTPMQFSRADKGIFPVIKSGYKSDLVHICNELDIPHNETINVQNVKWVTTKVNKSSITWKSNRMRYGIVPDVRGMTLRDALFLLENVGLNVKWIGKGRVQKQSQYPGRKALKGSRITVELS